MFRIKQRTKRMLYAGIAGACITGIAFASIMVHQNNEADREKLMIQQRLEAEIKRLEESAVENKIQGWVPIRELQAGHIVTTGDVTAVELPAHHVPSDLLKSREEIAGKTMKLTVKPNTLLTETLLYEEEATPDDLRYREMGFIQLPAVLNKQDVVDVRIQFPTGQDYILLSKKKVKSLVSGTVTMTLDETEILSLSSAIVDAYLHKASIYALLYVEPGLQAKAVPTYPANEAVLELIKKDPNIVKRAENALNLSSRARLEADLSVMSNGAAAEYAERQAAQGAFANSVHANQFVMSPSE